MEGDGEESQVASDIISHFSGQEKKMSYDNRETRLVLDRERAPCDLVLPWKHILF